MNNCSCNKLHDKPTKNFSKFVLPSFVLSVALAWQLLGASTPLPYTVTSVPAANASEYVEEIDSPTDPNDIYEIVEGEQPAFIDSSSDVIEVILEDIDYTSLSELDEKQAELAHRALRFALDQVGKPYVAGMRGPQAYDCSGLTYAAYKNAGLKWPMMTSYNQRSSKYVKAVKPGSEKPGDLIFTDFLRDGSQIPRGLAGPKGVDHVSMVLDPAEGTMVEAVGGRGVVIRKYHDNGTYLPQLISFGRVDFKKK